MTMEFETETTMDEFNNLFKASFPEGCDPRQRADLLAFFLGGHLTACTQLTTATCNLPTLEAAVVFMEDVMLKDSLNRGTFLSLCLIDEDLSHEMFKVQ